MKLVNFLTDKSLNELRDKMGAKLIKWNGTSSWVEFDPFGFRASLREKGEVDIPFSEISVAPDGTLELYGQKILVYIRDQKYGSDFGYKFHIANCSTLIEAQANKKYEKYVASINTNGMFKVNLVSGSMIIKKDIETALKVCKNCLSALNYKGYRDTWNLREPIYNSFTVEAFFTLYKKPSIKKPVYTNVTAPANVYPKDFAKISDELKRQKNYTCESCNTNFRNDRIYLHVHHLETKYKNAPEQLKVLCLGCHSDQPGHGHMKHHPDFPAFTSKYGNRS